MKEQLKKLHADVNENLLNRTDWQAYKGHEWRLVYVAVSNDGSLTAIVKWGFSAPIGSKEQYIGVVNPKSTT